MTDRHEIIEKARELGFVDIGFTTAEPFGSVGNSASTWTA